MTTLYLSISQLAQRIDVCWCENYHRFTHSHLMNMNLAVSYPRIAFEQTRIIKYLPVRLLLNTRVYFYDPICYFINFLLPTSFFPYRFKIYLTLKAILSLREWPGPKLSVQITSEHTKQIIKCGNKKLNKYQYLNFHDNAVFYQQYCHCIPIKVTFN